MNWIVIGIVLLVAFGPVLWLMPTPKDRRLAALRARGRVEGLVIELRHIPKLDPAPHERVSAGGKVRTPMIEVAAYGHPLPRKLRFLPLWRLVRTTVSEPSAMPDPFPGWSYDRRPDGPQGRRYLSEMSPLAEVFSSQLPKDVVAIEVDSRLIRVYWLENPGSDEASVSNIAGLLRGFEAELMALEAQIEARSEINDS